MSRLRTFCTLARNDNNGLTGSTEYHVVKKILVAVFAATCAFGANAQNAAPTVALTAPAANASFIGPATIALTAAAADSDGTIASVAFYNGTTKLTTDTVAPYSYNWTNVAAGSYTITSRATDNANVVTVSAPLQVTVKTNVKPAVTLTAPQAGSDNIAPATIALAATASDSDGNVSRVTWYRDGIQIGYKTVEPYTYNWTNVAAGTYSVTATATDDKAGVTTSNAVTVVVKPNQLPTVAIAAPLNGATVAAPGTFQLQASAADSDGSIVSVSYYNGATLLSSPKVAPYVYNWTNVAVGSYTITAKALDSKGGVQTSVPVNVMVNTNVAPAVALSAPENNASFAAPGVITLTATASDSDGSVGKVAFYNGTTLLKSITAPPYSYTWSGAAVGSYNLTAKATDDKNVETTSAVVVVNVKANVAPTVSVSSPVNNTTFYGPATMTLAANATDNDGKVNKIAFYRGATLIGNADLATSTLAWVNPPVGMHSVTAKATDDKGLTTTSAAVAVTVKAAPVPSISITGPGNDASFTAPATLSFTATATVTGDTISKVEYISGVNTIGTATAPPYTVTLNNVIAGNYAVTAKATGVLGGTAMSGSVSIKVLANAAPAVTFTASPENATAPAALTLNALPTDSDGTIDQVEFYNGATLLGTATQPPYTFTWSNVAAGSYMLTAKAFDNQGAVTTSASQTITVAGAAAPVTSQVFYIYSDQINTARQITNAAGVKVWQADPDPFGANPPNENPAGQGQFAYNQRFPGQYFDKETGLHYNYYRDYDPQTGRYVQSDPIGLKGGINTYGYVAGNPVSNIDPSGLVIRGLSQAETARLQQAISQIKCYGLPDLAGALGDKLKSGQIDIDTELFPGAWGQADNFFGGIHLAPELFKEDFKTYFVPVVVHEYAHLADRTMWQLPVPLVERYIKNTLEAVRLRDGEKFSTEMQSKLIGLGMEKGSACECGK
jgi:RHS repeat-associated protein